jgi:hypothetical protein
MYLFAIMSGAFAITGPPLPTGVISYNGSIIDSTILNPQSIQLTMFNGSDLLSEAGQLDELSMYFLWKSFR